MKGLEKCQIVANKGVTLKKLMLSNQKKNKGVQDVMNSSNVAYSIPCSDCDSRYCGQTRQLLKNRIASHKSELKHLNQNNSFVQHFLETGHKPNVDKVSILFNEKHYKSRLNLETMSIFALGSSALNHIKPVNEN